MSSRFLGVHFCATSTHETNLFPKLGKSKVIFCATSTHETHFRLFAKVLACSKTRDVNARNALVLKLSSRASSSCFSSPPEPVRNHPSRRITLMTDRLWGILGVIFLCDVNAFLAHFRKNSPPIPLDVSSCRLLAKVNFCAMSTRFHRLARQIRDGNRVYDQPSWAHLGAILGLSWVITGLIWVKWAHVGSDH